MQVLFIAVEDDRDSAAREQQRHCFIHAVLVVVDAQQAREIVAIKKSYPVVRRNKIAVLLTDGVVDFVKVAIVAIVYEYVAHRVRQRKIKQRHPAPVGKLDRVGIGQIGGPADIPLSVKKGRSGSEGGIGQRVLPTPGDVLDRIQTEPVHSVQHELHDGVLQVLINGGIFLVQVSQVDQGEVLQLERVIEVGDARIMVEQVVGGRWVVQIAGERLAFVEQSAGLAAIVWIAVVCGEIENHSDPVL